MCVCVCVCVCVRRRDRAVVDLFMDNDQMIARVNPCRRLVDGSVFSVPAAVTHTSNCMLLAVVAVHRLLQKGDHAAEAGC